MQQEELKIIENGQIDEPVLIITEDGNTPDSKHYDFIVCETNGSRKILARKEKDKPIEIFEAERAIEVLIECLKKSMN